MMSLEKRDDYVATTLILLSHIQLVLLSDSVLGRSALIPFLIINKSNEGHADLSNAGVRERHYICAKCSQVEQLYRHH